MICALRELARYHELIRHLVLMDLRQRYRGSVLGFVWTLLNPLLLMLVLWVVFSRFGRIDEENYALFLLAGLMMWLFFSQSVERALNSIVQNRGLIHKIYLPKMVFPVSIVVSNLVNLFFFLLAFVIIALAAYRIPLSIVLLPAVLAMLLLLSVGSALLMSAVNVFFRDFAHLTTVLLRALFYLTPVIYPPDILGPKIEAVLRINPAYYPIVIGRDVLYYGNLSSVEMWTTGFAMAVAILMVGLFVFIRSQHRFIYYA